MVGVNISTMLVGTFILAFVLMPIIVAVASIVRSLLLLSGRKRSFATWTRSRWLSVFSWLTAPGMAATIAIRYAVSRLMGIELGDIGLDTTFLEFNPYVVVERPPRVGVVVVALLVTLTLSVYAGMMLLIVTTIVEMAAPLVAAAWYLGLAILLNSCVRGGDLNLLRTSLQSHPRSGTVELGIVSLLVAVVYIRALGVLV